MSPLLCAQPRANVLCKGFFASRVGSGGPASPLMDKGARLSWETFRDWTFKHLHPTSWLAFTARALTILSHHLTGRDRCAATAPWRCSIGGAVQMRRRALSLRHPEAPSGCSAVHLEHGGARIGDNKRAVVYLLCAAEK